MLSAMFLNVSFYGLLRFHGITEAAIPGFSGPLLLAFGLLSVFIAVPFIVAQRDYKRLFAYSSVEHMGLAAVGFGLGGALATFAALLHMVNHAVVKAALFFTAGNLDLAYSTRRIESITGVGAAMPATGAGLVLGALAITGAPPFSLFVSELLLITAALQLGQPLVAAGVVVALVVVFGAFVAHAVRMGHGAPPQPAPREPSRVASAVILGLVGLALLFGLWLPLPVEDLARQAAQVLVPG
jgi:hydrogenase-4 component F